MSDRANPVSDPALSVPPRFVRRIPLRAGSVEEWISLARVVLLLTMIPALWAGIIALPEPSDRAVVVVLGGYVILLAVAPRWLAVFKKSDLIIALDLLVVTLVVLVSGRTESPFVYLYYLTILEAAARLNLRQALAVSTAMAGIIVLLWVGSGRGQVLETAAFRTGAFIASGFFLALLLGILVQEYRAAHEDVAELRVETALGARLSGELRLGGVVDTLLDAFLATVGGDAGGAYLVGDDGALRLRAARGAVWPDGDASAARAVLARLPAATVNGEVAVVPLPSASVGPPRPALLWLPLLYAGRLRLWLCGRATSEGPSDPVRRRLARIVALGAPALEAARLHEEVQRLASTDGLTGLANRRAFFERFEAEWNRARRTGRPLTVVLIDLNGFKHINDTRGHGAGDGVLVRVAAALADAVRTYDLAARFGGDEFALLLPDAAVAEAQAVLHRVGAIACAEAGAPAAPFEVTYAWGAAACPADGTSAEQLLQRADARLYAMKRLQSTPAPR